jgi:hypothetical protein
MIKSRNDLRFGIGSRSEHKIESVNGDTEYKGTHQQSKDELVGAELFHKFEIRN